MLALKAQYKDGKLTSLDGSELPHGTQEVIVTFLEDSESELHPEWTEELERRYEEYLKTGESTDGKTFFDELEKDAG